MTKYSGYDAIHLANSIVIYTKSRKQPDSICLLKLMKLSYIALGNYLAVKDDDYDFFAEDVQAWRYGPVIPSIWLNYKKYSLYNEIPATDKIMNKIFNENNNFLWGLVAGVCNKYRYKNADEMVEITHGEGTPWANHEEELLEGKMGIIIEKKEIRDYYRDEKNESLLLKNEEKKFIE